MRTTGIILYGSDQPLPEQIPLRAGPLSLIYENGDLRYIKLGERELLRRVYVAVRDHNWGTIHPAHSDVEMDVGEDRFDIAYTARHQQSDVDLVWKAHIRGSNDGTIEFSMDGEALTPFRCNRIGFCVLHPMANAGDRAVIEHVDGTLEESRFPQQIAPQLSIDGTIRPVYPFANMRSLAHVATPDLTAKVTFTGEIFEMEDQRNWTDASYKTYGTPLELPFPVEVAAGTNVVQSVKLTLEGAKIEERKIEDRADGDVVTVVVDRDSALPLPAIGLGVAGNGQPLTEREIERLRLLNLSHLRVDLTLVEPGYVEHLGQATAQARALGVELEIALFVGDDGVGELAALRERLDALSPPVCRWLVFHRYQPVTPAGLVDLARQYLESYAPDARFGAGSNAYFTDINRHHPDTQNADFLTYSLNPQVHAFDNASLVETIEAQAATVDSARSFANGKGIVVSPVTLMPRFNPNATGPEPEPEPGQLPPQVDVRQMSLFTAAWTVGSLKYLLGSGLEAVTYFETTGWRGVMEQEAGCSLPEQFHSTAGMVFPIYHVLADVGEFAGSPPSPPTLGGTLGQSQAQQSPASPRIGGRGADLLNVTTSDPLRVDGLALRHGDDLTLLVANLSPHTQQVQIDGPNSPARIRLLDAQTFDIATADPDRFRNQTNTISTDDGRFLLELSPYCVARIDSTIQVEQEISSEATV